MLRRLDHHNIVRYLGSVIEGSSLYIFLDYVSGGSITALIKNFGRFGEPLMRHFTSQVRVRVCLYIAESCSSGGHS